jgi:hypothetical protein
MRVEQKTIVPVIFLGFSLVTLLIGAIYPSTGFGRALAHEHPASVAWFMLLVMSAAWLGSIKLSNQAGEIARISQLDAVAVAWVIATLIPFIVLGLGIASEYGRWFYLFHDEEYKSMWVAISIFIPIFLLVFINLIGDRDESTSDITSLRRSGKLAALAIMILAMFAFGIEFHGGEHETTPQHETSGTHETPKTNKTMAGVTVHWPEIPAILIVFLLADIGVDLVVSAKRIEEEVRQVSKDATKAAGTAQAAVNQADELTDKMSGLSGGTTEAVKKAISQLADVAPVIQSKLYASSRETSDSMGMDQTEFWTHIKRFTDSWTPREPGGQETKKLLGILFDDFIGRNPDVGTVRSTDHSVMCITEDAVFANASERWLEEMQKPRDQEGQLNETEKRQLVIWAVTRLLPTEFAFPSLWLSTSDTHTHAPTDDGATTRLYAFERFIESVINTCRDGKGMTEPVEYRRVTVLDQAEHLANNPNVTGALTENERMNSSLSDWFILDPRVLKTASFDEELSVTDTYMTTFNVTRQFLENDGMADALVAGVPLRWSDLEPLYDKGADNVRSKNGIPRVFPQIPGFLGLGNNDDHNNKEAHFHNKEVLLLDMDFPAFKEVQDSGYKLRERKKGYVLGATERFLDKSIEVGDLERLEFGRLTPMIKVCIDARVQRRQLLQALGWRTVQDWYCECLHTQSGDNSEAWWMEVSDVKETQSLQTLTLNWKGQEVVTLDLLLIGSRSALGESSWHAAAISNLSFDKTECTVQLVTGQDKLRAISNLVKMHSSDVDEDKLPTDPNIIRIGRWQDWPKPTVDKTKDKARVDELPKSGLDIETKM